MKILKRIFNQKYDFMTKCYLYLDYKKNLKQIRQKHKLSNIDFILYMKINLNSDRNKNTQQTIRHYTFPDFKTELEFLKEEKRRKLKEKIINKISEYIKLLNIKRLMDIKNSQNNIQKFFAFLSLHVGTYKKSLQELVEGQREVTQNKQFTFDDGDTVQEKMDRFEYKIKEHLNVESHLNNLKNNINKKI
jgi:hypothetical protein